MIYGVLIIRNEKILITGGMGFIGAAISNYFVNKGYDITILDNNSRGNISRIKHNRKNIKFIKEMLQNTRMYIKLAKAKIVYFI